MRSAPRQAVYSLFIHGIGTQDAGWSYYAQRKFAAACDQRNAISYAKEVYYAPLFNMHSTRFLQSAEEHGSKGSMTQKLSVNTLADALQWQGNAQTREKICHVVDYEYLQLRAPRDVVIFAHSLGCLVALEWLKTRQGVKNVTLLTMGFNAKIFNLGSQMYVPPQVSKPGSWLNLWDRNDFLGFPAHADSPELAHVVDVNVEVGGFISGSTGLAHVCWMEDKDLWTQVVPNLLGLA